MTHMFIHRQLYRAVALLVFSGTTPSLIISRAQLLKCSSEVSVVQEQLASHDFDRRHDAAICIANNPDNFQETLPAVAEIIEDLKTPQIVARPAIWAAGKLAEAFPVDPALAADLAENLIARVQDEGQTIEVRRVSAYTLGKLAENLAHSPDSRGAKLASETVNTLATILHDRGTAWTSVKSLNLLSATTDAIHHSHGNGEVAVREVIGLLQESESVLSAGGRLSSDQTALIQGIQNNCAGILGDLPTDPSDAAPTRALLILLSRNQSDTVQATIYALAQLGPRPEIQDRAPLIFSHIASGNSDIRRVSSFATGRIHSPKYTDQSLKALQKALSDPVEAVRTAAVQAIPEFDSDHTVTLLPVLTARLQSEIDPGVQLALMSTIGSIAQQCIPLGPDKDKVTTLQALQSTERDLKTKLSTLSRSDPSYDNLRRTLEMLGEAQMLLRGHRVHDLIVSHPIISVCAALYIVWIGVCLVILQTRPLRILKLNSMLGSFVDLDIPLPLGLGRIKVPLRYAIFIGFLNYRLRVLDAWVDEHSKSACQSLSQRQTVRERQIYVPLPTYIKTNQTIKVSVLTADSLREICAGDRWCIRILGEGGSGKTSLACRIAYWCMASEPSQRLFSRHRALPLILEPGNMAAAEVEGASFTEILRSQLQAATRSAEAIDSELYSRLIRMQRVVVILDGASEMAVFNKQDRARLEETFPAGALIVTARNTELFAEGGYTDILPQRIDSDHLIPFLNAYLSHMKVQVDDSRLYEACRRLSLMVGKERGITPLLAELYARTLVGMSDAGMRDSSLPASVPELMLSYLQVINRGVEKAQFDDLEVQRACKRLAWECICETYRPVRASKEALIYSKQNDQISAQLFSYLENRLRVVDTVAGASFQFVFDPLAEYFGAIFLVENTRADKARWTSLMEKLDDVSATGGETLGFLLALSDVLDWKGGGMNVPSSIAPEVKQRVSRTRTRVQAELEGPQQGERAFTPTLVNDPGHTEIRDKSA